MLLKVTIQGEHYAGKKVNGILFVLRTDCQWNALSETGTCSSSTAHSRFQEWTPAAVFQKLWAMALKDYDELKGIDWSWQSMDGAVTKAPLRGGENRHKPTDRAKKGVKRSLLTEASGVPIGLAIDGANRHDCEVVQATIESIAVERTPGTYRAGISGYVLK
jgi:transposase